MTDILNELIRQRDELDRRISERRQVATDTYADAMDALYRALVDYTEHTKLQTVETVRKNVLTVNVASRVIVKFGRIAEGYRESFAIEWGNGSRAEFEPPLPPVPAFLGFIWGLIGEQS